VGCGFTFLVQSGPDSPKVTQWSSGIAVRAEHASDVKSRRTPSLFGPGLHHQEARCGIPQYDQGSYRSKGGPVKTSVIAALTSFGLNSMTIVEKPSMRDLILRGHPYSIEKQKATLDYCSEDVEGLATMLPVMLTVIDLSYAIFRGRCTTVSSTNGNLWHSNGCPDP
jgi:hypothetical protein